VTALAQDASGRLLLINRGRAVVYDGRTFEAVPPGGNNVRAGPLAALAAGASGDVWAVSGSDPQVYRWSSGSWETLPRLPLPDGREWSATALAGHPAGKLKIEPFVPERIAGMDLLFASLPTGRSREPLARVPQGIKIIDVGGDHRFVEGWTYGLTEFAGQRAKIVGANRVANPGCYPAAVLLALAPLVGEGLVEPEGIVVDAKSGVTGTGRELASSFFAALMSSTVSVTLRGFTFTVTLFPFPVSLATSLPCRAARPRR
jgi:hypothetical protein